MGVIGFSLYDNDVACDVKKAFEDMIYSGVSCREATANIICDFQEYLQDSDDRPIVWISLADIQWEMGLLLKNIKKRAVKEIDELITDDVYDENYEFKQDFFENLKSIKNKLDLPMPPKVKIKKQSRKIHPSLWEKGNVYRIQLTIDILQYDSVKYLKDKWLMLKVIDIIKENEKNSVYYRPIMQAYISKDSIMPNLSQLTELEPIVIYGDFQQGFEYRFCVIDLTEFNIKNYCYCGKTLLLPTQCKSITDVKNILHFNADDLANELAWYYYYLKKELDY